MVQDDAGLAGGDEGGNHDLVKRSGEKFDLPNREIYAHVPGSSSLMILFFVLFVVSLVLAQVWHWLLILAPRAAFIPGPGPAAAGVATAATARRRRKAP